MTINPAHDIWVWGAAALFLVLMGSRAWVVETSRTRLGRTSAKAKALSGAIVVSLAGLVVLLGLQGGDLLVTSIVNGTDPSAAYYGTAHAAPAAPAPTTGG
ncbi:hypothetical protein [Pseudonocardia sp.]|jgi:hypothetical protein|uniref:hypothetical protein n=1 Tax=Pseudonocardia sp. TaxID=60912 RepID=UPI00261108BD|nr:hypothetical protein [Pseudonocardia sp.]MCW2717719.1 hypothetical protein [Pseudonocardia sp.]MDT7613478.1 hypothetical protein [Pseudonocardiales bacterium]